MIMERVDSLEAQIQEIQAGSPSNMENSPILFLDQQLGSQSKTSQESNLTLSLLSKKLFTTFDVCEKFERTSYVCQQLRSELIK